MLELLKLFIESLLKIWSADNWSQKRKDARLNQLGAKLYCLYVDLNEILICGKLIASRMEEYLKDMENYKPRTVFYETVTPDCYFEGFKLNHIVKIQSKNLLDLSCSIMSIKDEIQILDADLYRDISKVISDKPIMLYKIMELLSRGELPVTTKKYISTNEVWDEKNKNKIKNYIEKRRSMSTINEIEDLLKRFRVILSENFSTKDILLEVGTQRYNRSTRVPLLSEYFGENLKG